MAAPKGNQFAKGTTPTRRARNALCRVLATDKLKGINRLDEIWAKQVMLAIQGDAQAVKLIVETLDGKPRQQVEATGANGGPIQISAIDVSALTPEQLKALSSIRLPDE